MDLYWRRRMFFHFPSRQNIGACVFEVGDDKNDLDYFYLKMPFFVFPAQVGCSRGSHPHSAWTPCVLWCATLTIPVRREHAGFYHWTEGEQNPRDKREILPRLHAALCSGILDQLLQRVMKCLKTPSELPFRPFSYRKYGAFAFLNSRRSHTDLAAWGQHRQVPLLHGHWWTWMANTWSLSWPVTIPQLQCEQMPWHRFGLHLHLAKMVSWHHLGNNSELFPKLILLGWGEHSLVQPLLRAQGTAPHPVLLGFLGIISLHL